MIGVTLAAGHHVQDLLKVLFDIVLLRRGPEELPHSWIVLNMCVGLWLLALFAMTVLIETFDMRDAVIAVASAAIGVFCYSLALVARGYSARFLQTISALIGTGALISFAMLVMLVAVPFIGPTVANITAFLLLGWSVPVKGHIIARAIGWHWYAGIAIALAIFILQLTFTQTLT